MRLLIQKLDPAAKLPVCAHPGQDLGYDLFALEDTVLEPGVPTAVRTGIAAYYEGTVIQAHGLLIRDRSSVAKFGIVVTGGVVDAGYRGEIIVMLTNAAPMGLELIWDLGALQNVLHEHHSFRLKAGDKIAQMIPVPVLTYAAVQEMDKLPEGDRGAAGFGSTGR